MKKNGFTLVEVISIIFILGLLAILSVSTVNKMITKSKVKVMEANSNSIQKAVIANCKMEKLDKVDLTKLYTIIDRKIDNDIEFSGELPENGYILLDNSCNVAYSFYDGDYTSSKNFIEDEILVDSKDSVKSFGLEWKSNKTNYKDTYIRTLDASDIDNNDVKVQVGDEVVTNAFDELDIYKDILPYTDEFGNEFMLIPKFYISKTKEVTGTEVIWNYAVSKQKLDDTYYLPSCFVDEGIDNDQHIELPYVLVGKYEAGSELIEGTQKLVSKSGITPRVVVTINTARTLATNYNSIEEINGYQQYDIHIHDLLTTLFAIEFGTMNSQNIMRGYVDNTSIINTGESDYITSSSGTRSNDGHNSFNYRGIENLWGNIWKFVEGVNVDQSNGQPHVIYAATNARHYSSDNVTKYYSKLNYYKSDTSGHIAESGMDSKFPFVNLPVRTGGNMIYGTGDNYFQIVDQQYKILLVGGNWGHANNAGMSYFNLYWFSGNCTNYVGARLLKSPLQD